MKYTVVGDQHITHKSLDRGAQLFDLVEEIGLPAIWMGDLLDTKEVIRGKCLNAVIEYLGRSKLNHIFIVGNHDWFNHSCEDHSLQALKVLSNVKVVDSPEVIDGMLFVPYIHDLSKLDEVLTRFRGLIPTLFGHLEVATLDFGNGHICTKGLPLEDLRGYKRVISGHFHKFQESGNLTYIGTPFSHSFGETNQTKYIGMYDSDTDEFKKAETPFPQHVTLEFNCDDLEDDSIVWDYSRMNDPNNLYRVILTGKQQNIDMFPKDLFDNRDVKWIARPSDDVVNNVAIDETVSNEAQFSSWARDIRGLDDETVKLGMSILEACR